MADKATIINDVLDLKEVFYTNLLLLGFDHEAEEAKHRIPFNKDMFLFPNKKAMEAVCHFLFCRLDPQLAFQEFRDCWPIQDKKMEQQFRKSCNSWLSKIYKEDKDSNLPRIGPSLFLSPGGARFYELMFYFSLFVMRQVMTREHGKHGRVPSMFKISARNKGVAKTAVKAYKTRTVVEKNRFFEEVEHALKVQECWKTYAMNLTREHRRLTKKIRELEKKSGSKTEYFDKETDILYRTKKIQQLRELWSRIEKLYDDTKQQRSILDEILQDTQESFSLNGSEILLQVPEVLTNDYKQHIQMKNIGSPYQAGKLNLLSMIQLCHLALHHLKETLKQGAGILQLFEQYVPYVNKEIHDHTTRLINTQKLRSVLLEKLIPELKTAIGSLKVECYSHLQNTDKSHNVALDSFNFGLGLLPATPLPDFAPSSQKDHGTALLRDHLLRKTPRQDTPDAVENLTSSVREMVINNKRDERQIGHRSVVGSETPKPFSKIPRPVAMLQQRRTPDITTQRSKPVLRRASLTSVKKPRRTSYGSHSSERAMTPPPRTDKFASTPLNIQYSSQLRQNANPPTLADDNVDELVTPVRTGLKSALKKKPTSARNVLADKIAKAVFLDEPLICLEDSSSPNSSGNTTPKDIGIADPVSNINNEAFISKDLIPRTPMKNDSVHHYISDEGSGDDEVVNEENIDVILNATGNRMMNVSSVKQSPAHVLPEAFTSKVLDEPSFTPQRSPCVVSTTDFLNGNTSVGMVCTPIQPFTISYTTPLVTQMTTSYSPIESKLTTVDFGSPEVPVNGVASRNVDIDSVKDMLLRYKQMKEKHDLRTPIGDKDLFKSPSPINVKTNNDSWLSHDIFRDAKRNSESMSFPRSEDIFKETSPLVSEKVLPERDNVKLSLFPDTSPLLSPSQVDNSPHLFALQSPVISPNAASLVQQDLQLIDVDTSDLFADELRTDVFTVTTPLRTTKKDNGKELNKSASKFIPNTESGNNVAVASLIDFD